VFLVHSGPARDITAIALSYSGALEVKIVFQNPFVVTPSLFLLICWRMPEVITQSKK